jgi:integral membrane sensor domain MASE1
MMVAFYRHAGKMWPGIAVVCSSAVSATMVMFPASSQSLVYGHQRYRSGDRGMLLRKFLPWYNPLQNLNDWIRLAIGSALIPPCWAGC